MNKKLLIAGGLLIVILAYFSIKPLLFNLGHTSAKELQLDGTTIKDDQGEPFTGSLKLDESDLGTVINQIPQMLEPLSKNVVGSSLPLDLRDETEITKFKKLFKGFTIQMEVENGKPSGETKLYYNIREDRDDLFGREIEGGIGYATAYAFGNQVQLASIEFEEGKLNGTVQLQNPGITSNTLVSLEFVDNEMKAITRFHANGEVKRINRYSTGRIKDGKQEEYNEEGTLIWDGEFKEGKALNITTYYGYPEQSLREEIVFENGRVKDYKKLFPDGSKEKIENASVIKEYYSNGELKLLREKGDLYNSEYNKPKGEIKTYHNNGRVHTSFVYDDNGTKNGPYVIKYANDETWETGTYENGRLQGKFKKWYNNSQLAEDHLMVDGRIDGKFVRYYSNGQLWKEFEYDEGRLSGSFKKWYNNGQLAEDHTMTNGKIDGKYVRFYDDGKKHVEGSFDNGKKVGIHIKWFKNGQMASKVTYSNTGRLEEKTVWDLSGNKRY